MFGYFVALKVIDCTPRGRVQLRFGDGVGEGGGAAAAGRGGAGAGKRLAVDPVAVGVASVGGALGGGLVGIVAAGRSSY